MTPDLATLRPMEYASTLIRRSKLTGTLLSSIYALMDVTLAIIPHRHRTEFGYRSIWNLNCIVEDVEAYQTVYLPYGSVPYRISITGNQLTMEYAQPPGNDAFLEAQHYVEMLFGNYIDGLKNVSAYEQEVMGKILPISG